MPILVFYGIDNPNNYLLFRKICMYKKSIVTIISRIVMSRMIVCKQRLFFFFDHEIALK